MKSAKELIESKVDPKNLSEATSRDVASSISIISDEQPSEREIMEAINEIDPGGSVLRVVDDFMEDLANILAP